MARMFGFIGNRSDLGARVLRSSASILRVRRSGAQALGWGIGFYQFGEALLRRRPMDDRDVIDLAEATDSVRTDVLIGHVRNPHIGALRTENTQPFRYRLWLYAQTGTILGFEHLSGRLLDSQPDFLRRNVRGETDSELSFYLFLSFLHDSGHLDEQSVDPQHISAALRASVALVDRLSAEEGHGPNQGDILVTNGEHLLLVHRSGKAALRVLKGRYDVEELLGEEETRRARIPSVESTRFCIVASELEEVRRDWTPIETRSIVTLTRSADPIIEKL
ncbi:MAG TPA: class II glutamine amidotransferase [Polyangiaceae bacterium]|jgi:glutamine amidotransferase